MSDNPERRHGDEWELPDRARIVLGELHDGAWTIGIPRSDGIVAADRMIADVELRYSRVARLVMRNDVREEWIALGKTERSTPTAAPHGKRVR